MARYFPFTNPRAAGKNHNLGQVMRHPLQNKNTIFTQTPLQEDRLHTQSYSWYPINSHFGTVPTCLALLIMPLKKAVTAVLLGPNKHFYNHQLSLVTIGVFPYKWGSPNKNYVFPKYCVVWLDCTTRATLSWGSSSRLKSSYTLAYKQISQTAI